ncbi:MAG: HD domain-containing protein [Firmicutes bacterium]|nr:HD domain-containing protein [Bacillota bacterium]
MSNSLFPEIEEVHADYTPEASVLKRHATLLSKVRQRRQEVQKFEKFLATETCWLSAPASTRFHLCRPGGLLIHSIGVAETLLKLRAVLAPQISEESCVIVGLYHDVGKVGLPGQPYYIPNPNDWQRQKRGIPYAVNPAVVHMDIATRSLFLAAKFLDLTPEEAQAIRYHDGQYLDANSDVAHRECPLTLLLQYADNWTASVLERDS